MSLTRWLAEGRLHAHQTDSREVADLLRIVRRDLTDAGISGLSDDRRFTTAYNAALQLATVVLRLEGYRTSGTGHHWVTFQALPEMLGEACRSRADYLDACRRKRNMADYDAAGSVSAADVVGLLREVMDFQTDVSRWLRDRHAQVFAALPADLLPGGLPFP